MITTAGKTHAARTLAAVDPNLGQTISLGIGETAPTLTDAALDLEVARIPVSYSAYDALNSKVILRGTIPSDYPITITEVGVYSDKDIWQGIPQNTKLFRFGLEAAGLWVGTPTWSSANGRSGFPRMIHAGSKTTVATIQLDLSTFVAVDKIALAAQVAAGTTNITIDFRTDASNYYRWSFTPTTGYKVFKTTIGQLTTVGNPDWSKITDISVANTSGNVEFDMLTLTPLNVANAPGTLVSRSVVTPIVVVPNQPQEIEVHVGVSL